MDPKHTSQRCPRCGLVSSKNRKGHLFRCKSCGYASNADIVAAVNNKQVYLNTLLDGHQSTCPEAPASVVRCKPTTSVVGG
ncbi:zinc ribbon domain-containing protein [Pseudothermotoga sp. U03pept]|uniref:zinc ribbon domain-containing protein n=1 Tax=Pseudothermotoga sp. U03pept TaxID=3447012 RepID=UPI003F12691E